jgi:hypothetical protein
VLSLPALVRARHSPTRDPATARAPTRSRLPHGANARRLTHARTARARRGPSAAHVALRGAGFVMCAALWISVPMWAHRVWRPRPSLPNLPALTAVRAPAHIRCNQPSRHPSHDSRRQLRARSVCGLYSRVIRPAQYKGFRLPCATEITVARSALTTNTNA